jgi:RND family efflux transporter MFP subunit
MDIRKAKDLRLEDTVNRDAEIQAAGRGLPVRWISAAVAALVVLLGLLYFWPHPVESPPAQPPAASFADAPTATSTAGEFSAGGYIEPIPPFPVKIVPLVPGRIDEFSVVEGQALRAGDVIARLNTENLAKRAEEIRAARDVNRRRLELAEKELARTEALVTKGAATGREFDQAQAEVRILRAEDGQRTAELSSIEWQMENSVIRSPVDGILYERLTHTGDFIDLDEQDEIASVMDPAKIQVWVDVNQRDAARIHVGRRAAVTLDAEPGREFPAVVRRILPRASIAKNTIRCILELEATSPALRPDMSVKVTFREP